MLRASQCVRQPKAYFLLCCCAMSISPMLSEPSKAQQDHGSQPVRFEENSADPSADNLACYKITTPTATYFLEKEGLGLSSLLDTEGIDWIGFHPEKGSGPRGEYRGFPNAVFKEGGSFFHPRNTGIDRSTSFVRKVDPEQVSIAGVSGNADWECRWDFYTSHCTFTMTKMPVGRKYWVLYEGTPGGECDGDDWWMTSAIQEKKALGSKHDDDIPAPEWIAFGDPRHRRVLFMMHDEDDQHIDSYYLMRESMAVFGFGRQKLKKFISTVPQTFALGFLESTDHKVIAKRIKNLSERAGK